MLLNLNLLKVIVVVVALTEYVSAGSGYHYNRPVQSISSITHGSTNTGGHHFNPLPTVSPLPPVPALPPLPTARPSGHIQTLVQVHPPPATASKSIANAYRPPSSAHFQNTYLPPAAAPSFKPSQQLFVSPQPERPFITSRAAEVAPQPQSTPGIFGQRAPARGAFQTNSFPSGPASLSQAAPQPLRVPFGKQAVVHLPTGEDSSSSLYSAGGRQVKQYAVIEIIDNDIEQNTRPFLTNSFIDNYRAQIGASGTGAVPPPPGQQIDSRSNALVMEQQRLGQQPRGAVALGSGGLGFIRLPNGNVYLGSGSLGYISGQEHSELVQNARTRTGASMPDALHFGHGALGNPGNAAKFRTYRL